MEISSPIKSLLKTGPYTRDDEGLLRYGESFYVPATNELRTLVTKECHDALISGHPGRRKTIQLVRRHYWWPGLKGFVNHYIDSCDLCCRTRWLSLSPQRLASPPKNLPNYMSPMSSPSMGFRLVSYQIVDQNSHPVFGEHSRNSERVNQVLEQYNNTPHSSTTMSPFFANKGYHPRASFTPDDNAPIFSPPARASITDLSKLHEHLQIEMSKAQESAAQEIRSPLSWSLHHYRARFFPCVSP